MVFSLKNGSNAASFCLFSFFSHDKYRTSTVVNDKSVDGVPGTQTRGSRMVGADKSTELWWIPMNFFSSFYSLGATKRLLFLRKQ